MSDRNVCPYCGSENLKAVRLDRYNNKQIPHQPNTGYRGTCCDCGLEGSWIQAEDDCGYWYFASWQDAERAAIAAFCHPAHLHTYDPQTQVVISREAARRVAVTWFVDSPFSSADDDAVTAELRAALEATHEAHA